MAKKAKPRTLMSRVAKSGMAQRLGAGPMGMAKPAKPAVRMKAGAGVTPAPGRMKTVKAQGPTPPGVPRPTMIPQPQGTTSRPPTVKRPTVSKPRPTVSKPQGPTPPGVPRPTMISPKKMPPRP